MPKENETDSDAHQQLRRKLTSIHMELRRSLPEGCEYVLSVSGEIAEAERRGYFFTNVPVGERAAHLERLGKFFANETEAPKDVAPE